MLCQNFVQIDQTHHPPPLPDVVDIVVAAKPTTTAARSAPTLLSFIFLDAFSRSEIRSTQIRNLRLNLAGRHPPPRRVHKEGGRLGALK
ncbi:hypothetical protein HKD37_11G030597 [Glycine soja]